MTQLWFSKYTLYVFNQCIQLPAAMIISFARPKEQQEKNCRIIMKHLNKVLIFSLHSMFK